MRIFRIATTVNMIFIFCIACYSQNNNLRFPFEWQGKIGYIDKQFNVKIQPRYKTGSQFLNNKALVTLNGYYAIIDENGNIVKQFDNEIEKMFLFEEGFLLYKKGKDWTILNNKYEKIFTSTMLIKSMYYYGFINNGLILVEVTNGYTFIDKIGHLAFGETYFNYASGFSEGLAAVQKEPDDKFGFINTKGEFEIPPQYDGVFTDFSENLCAVEKDGRTFYIDKNNHFLFFIDMNTAYPFRDGVGLFSTGMSFHPIYNIINSKGDVLLKDFDAYVEPFKEGFAVFNTPVIRTPKYVYKYGFLDKNGKIFINPKFDKTKSYYNGFAEVWIGRDQGFIDTKGNVVWVKDFMK